MIDELRQSVIQREQELQCALNTVPRRWKIYLVIAVVLAVVLGGWALWQHLKPPAVITQTIEVPSAPQIIQHTTETVREVAVQSPSQQGAVLQIVERDGKVYAQVGDQTVEVPNQTGQSSVKLGDNGELRISSTSTAKIDVTDMANAQARLIANQELEKQAKINAAAMQKEKDSRNRERALWIVGTAGYLLSR